MSVIFINPYRFGATYDADAAAYIAAVEAADGQALETAVKDAINAFVVGCKTDGTWNAIKASCILAGARTLAGALVPLVGVAPTNFNFVAGDYNRKTGLVGDGSTKYLDSNRNNNADPQNDNHNSVYATTTANGVMMGCALSAGNNQVATGPRSRNSQNDSLGTATIGLYGINRNISTSFVARSAGINTPITRASTTPDNGNVFIFARNASSRVHSNSRLAFYSIGEAVDLALLDARVTALINAFAAAIP